jgi:hypothetical protein
MPLDAAATAESISGAVVVGDMHADVAGRSQELCGAGTQAPIASV